MENKVLAKVNGNPITQADVNVFMERLGPQRSAQFQTEEGQTQILSELVNQSLFCADAITNKLDETDAYKAEMDKMKEMVLTQINVSSLLSSVTVTDEDVKSFFDANPTNFAAPASADTNHILVDNVELAKEIRTKIISKEVTFEEAAKEHSSCPSKDTGGKLGSYPKGQMVPEYDNASFTMNEGDISEPVQTQFGFHIIRLNAKTVAGEATFEDVKDKAKADLLSEKQREAYMAKIVEMQSAHNVEYV
ncbi:MAG: peptidylprolyl isomerase [Candidatus Zophobacter franzmannii]|nr:peptidylprolyl isomerase [Candidatus Zophobacter franzmannii]